MPRFPDHAAPAALVATMACAMTPMAAFAASVTVGTGQTDTTRYTLSGTDTAQIANGGTLATSGTALTLNASAAAPGLSVQNAGTLRSGNRGIDSSGSGGSPFIFTLNNQAGASIETSDDAVRINTDVPVGSIVVDNAGTITSQGGQAIDFDKINTAGHVVINNRAGGLIQAMDADAVRPGEGGVVNNDGRIISYAPANTSGDPDDDPSNDGVDLQGHAATVNNNAGGLISGARHGITSDVDVNVTNAAGGTIIGRNGSGVGSDGDGTVVNRGTITGAIDTTSVNGDGDGVDIDGKAQITNYGTIQGVGAKGQKDGSANTSEGVAVGGGTIRNMTAGSLISGQTNGILVDDSNAGNAPAPTVILNNGTIRGVTGFGIKLIGNQADNVTNAGLIQGGNGLALDMGGGDDTLTVQGGASFAGLVDGGAGTDTVQLLGTGTFAGASNFELLNISGAWILTGSQQYANGITVASGGSLDVQGSLAGMLNVGPGAVLDGSGTLDSARVAGTVAPGHSIGTLTFTGNYTQLPGSTYQAEIASGGQSDLISVAGTATLDGSVVVTPLPGTQVAPGARYTLLSAGQGINGRYGSATSTANFVFLQPDLYYDANHVYLQFDRNATRYADFAQTRNQRAAANGADSQPNGQPVHDTIALMGDDASALRDAYDSLSGEIHASLKSALIEDSHFTRDAINDRLRAAFAGNASGPIRAASAAGTDTLPAASDRGTVWAQAYGAWGGIDGNGNASRLDRSVGGFIVGADFPLGRDWRAGVAAGYDHTDLDLDGRASGAGIDSYTLAAYTGTRMGPWGLRLGAASTWHDIDTTRNVGFAGFAGETDKASYSGNTAQLFAETGYTIERGASTFEPFAGLAYTNLHTRGFDEGGEAGLSGRSDNTGVTFSTVGLRAATRFDAGGKTAVLRGMLGWRHAFGDTTPTATQSLPGGSPFTVAGVPVAVDAAVIQVGFDLHLTTRVKAGLSYTGQLGDGVHQNGVMAALNVTF
jgi:outer membrane autotransporter protein